MGKMNEKFLAIRNRLVDKINEFELKPALIEASGTSRNTVNETLKVNYENELVGKKLVVWNTALKLIEERQNLLSKSEKILNEG
ncbi:MAG: hypothetical protein ACK5LL_00335 [Suipraeoptans sp.]